MPRYDNLTDAIANFRAARGGKQADSTIRRQRTGDQDIDRASPEMLERALAGQSNSASTPFCRNGGKHPKSIAELDAATIWNRWNNPPAPGE